MKCMARKVETKKEDTFTKNQLIHSMKFKAYRDSLNVLLDDKKEYTIGEVEKMLTDFMKGKVN